MAVATLVEAQGVGPANSFRIRSAGLCGFEGFEAIDEEEMSVLVAGLVGVDCGHSKGFTVGGEVFEDGGAHLALLDGACVIGQGDNQLVSKPDAVGVCVLLAAVVDCVLGCGFQLVWGAVQELAR